MTDEEQLQSDTLDRIIKHLQVDLENTGNTEADDLLDKAYHLLRQAKKALNAHNASPQEQERSQ